MVGACSTVGLEWGRGRGDCDGVAPDARMEAPFHEQVSRLAALFERWGECERTVALAALLRRAPWPALRLLQEAAARALDVALAVDPERQRRDTEANDARAVANLASLAAVNSEVEPTKGAPDQEAEVDAHNKLRAFVRHLPLLRPGNEEAKRAYLRAVPHLVRYCVRYRKHLECQEMLSYLLIHPAITDSDKRSLTHWLMYFENHVINAGNPMNQVWPQKQDTQQSPSASWPTEGNQAFRRTIGKNVEFKATVDEVTSNGSETTSLHSGEDNLQESFSKNGTEIDVSNEIERTFFEPAIMQPKARRSNSLTPPSTSYNLISSSSENLNVEHFMQKPRSFSLSSEHSLLNVQAASNLSSSSGSETRLDDLRYNNAGDHDGMSTIAHWLKTLRLHKYIWLFNHISYDEMLAINEEYLQRLGVTKGARHKLLLCIKKLSERQGILNDMERELTDESTYITAAFMTVLLEQLRGIVISPIKPNTALAAHVVRVLDLASSRIIASGSTYQDAGAAVSLHCWLVDRALAHDAFSRNPALTAELKSLKYRVPPKQFFAHLGDATFQRRVKPRWRNYMNPNWQAPDNSKKSSSYPSFPPTPPIPKRLPPASSMGDINSRLESLCLQMTEQAIN